LAAVEKIFKRQSMLFLVQSGISRVFRVSSSVAHFNIVAGLVWFKFCLVIGNANHNSLVVKKDINELSEKLGYAGIDL
jgi:hypothetical protein